VDTGQLPVTYLERFDSNRAHHVTTVLVQARFMYRDSRPIEMRPVGETEFVNGIAAMRERIWRQNARCGGNRGPRRSDARAPVRANGNPTLGERKPNHLVRDARCWRLRSLTRER